MNDNTNINSKSNDDNLSNRIELVSVIDRHSRIGDSDTTPNSSFCNTMIQTLQLVNAIYLHLKITNLIIIMILTIIIMIIKRN